MAAFGGQLDRRAADLIGLIVEGAGQKAGGGGLADAAYAGQHEGMGDAARGEGVGQGADHGLLADQVLEGAGPVFARQHLIGGVISDQGGLRRGDLSRGAEHVRGVGVALDLGVFILWRG